VRILQENLRENAWRFTGKEPMARIAIGQESQRDETVFYVRDNGAEFDMTFADKLSAPFQRLYREADFR
jgi:light-regulated signal transduction histidine kinase (bacteriophytochrome)